MKSEKAGVFVKAMDTLLRFKANEPTPKEIAPSKPAPATSPEDGEAKADAVLEVAIEKMNANMEASVGQFMQAKDILKDLKVNQDSKSELAKTMFGIFAEYVKTKGTKTPQEKLRFLGQRLKDWGKELGLSEATKQEIAKAIEAVFKQK